MQMFLEIPSLQSQGSRRIHVIHIRRKYFILGGVGYLQDCNKLFKDAYGSALLKDSFLYY